jgi:hypothetical protein
MRNNLKKIRTILLLLLRKPLETRVLKQLKNPRILLTGTPAEDSLKEFYFSFLFINILIIIPSWINYPTDNMGWLAELTSYVFSCALFSVMGLLLFNKDRGVFVWYLVLCFLEMISNLNDCKYVEYGDKLDTILRYPRMIVVVIILTLLSVKKLNYR